MKQKQFKRKDGTDGVNYVLELGDKFTITRDSVLETKPRAGINKTTGKAFFTQSFLIEGIPDGKTEKILVSLTRGQAKVLQKQNGQLNGKVVTTAPYHTEKGDFIGVRIV